MRMDSTTWIGLGTEIRKKGKKMILTLCCEAETVSNY